jgi:hypothetical protein
MAGITGDDIAALRQQGDLSELLRGRPAAAHQLQMPTPEQPLGDRVPGAWPAGCQRPAPLPPTPPHIVAHALDEYRAWIRAGQPPGNYRCDCPPCRKQQVQ